MAIALEMTGSLRDACGLLPVFTLRLKDDVPELEFLLDAKDITYCDLSVADAKNLIEALKQAVAELESR